MPASEPLKKTVKPRGWLRRWTRRLGWLLLALAILHRPLIHYGVPFVAKLIAKRQHLDVDFELSGSIFTNLRVSNVRAVPNGSGPSPVEHIRIGEMRFDYSLRKLLRDGVGEFLYSYEMHHADLAFVALPSQTTTEKKQKQSLADTLQTVLAQPAAYADRVNIEDFNIRVRAPENETSVTGIDFLLEPDKPGYLRIASLAAPGLPEWKDIAAETSYENRNLFIRHLNLAPELAIDALNFDGSHRREKRGRIAIEAHVFGGTFDLELTGSELGKSARSAAKSTAAQLGEKHPVPPPADQILAKSFTTRLKVTSRGVDVPAALGYFHAPKSPVGKLTALDLEFTGEPDQPRTWNGMLGVRVAGVTAGPLTVEPVELSLKTQNGSAVVSGGAQIGSGRADISAKIALPAAVEKMLESEVDAMLTVTAPKLEEIGRQLAPPLALMGSVSANGHITLHEQRVQAEVQLTLEKAALNAQSVDHGQITVRATKSLKSKTPLGELIGSVNAKLQSIRAGSFTIDSVNLAAETQDEKITLQSAEIIRGDNTVSAKGDYAVPPEFADFANAPAGVEFSIHVPKLADFGLGADQKIVSGKIDGQGSIRMNKGTPEGSLTIEGSDFAFAGATAPQLTTKVTFADKTAVIEQLVLKLNAQDRLVVVGKAGLAAPFAYEGGVQFGVRDLAVFQPVLESFGLKEKLAGAVALAWTGKGDAAPARHTGDAKLDVSNVRYGAVDVRAFRFAVGYTPEEGESREFHVESGVTSIDGKLEFKEGKLRISNLDVRQAGQQALSGFVILPFDPTQPANLVPFDQRVAMNVNANNLDVPKLLASFGQKSPVSGTFSWNLLASGTLAEPTFFLKASARTLKAAAAPQYDPADLDLTLHYSQKEIELDATAKQPLIQPLAIKGHMPLDLDALRTTKQVDLSVPVEASVKLPTSSLAFLPKIVPAVRRIDGTAALDVNIGGTIEKPVFSGSAALHLKEMRMDAPNIPAVGNFNADLAFAEDTLNFRTFKGEVGGGTFNLGGKIRLGEGIVAGKTDGVAFDLALKADKVLAMRDDSITLRADADVKLTGPLNAASASGTVWVTQSRFFKEIDILPIGLPGRPKPSPKSAPSDPSISFPDPPLRDWKFDIAIKTREDDPFLVRGNLANGAVSLSLQLGGTGLAPWLDGQVRIDDFKASLPFSTLSITRGFVYFKKDEPFRASVDLQAESKIRDYTINALIHGAATDPQVEFSSEPPLPHADIVSLLATGTTTSELAGSADVLASRAAMLAVQSLYRKIFLHGAAKAPPPDDRKSGEGFMDRFQLELGAVDNRTGAREVNTRFKINEHTYFIGDLDTQGRYTGSLKYLLRFR